MHGIMHTLQVYIFDIRRHLQQGLTAANAAVPHAAAALLSCHSFPNEHVEHAVSNSAEAAVWEVARLARTLAHKEP